MEKYQVTGNEYVSLPAIRETDGALESLSFLYMGVKGMLEMVGDSSLIGPFLEINGEKISLSPIWERRHCWIPMFTSEKDGLLFRCIWLTPVGERGFVLRLEAENHSDVSLPLTMGAEGEWSRTLHTVNESIPLDAGRSVRTSGWGGMFFFQQVPGTPLFAFAPVTGDHQPYSHFDQGAEWSLDGYKYQISRKVEVLPRDSAHLDIFFGIGYEEVAAVTSGKEMLRQGFDTLLARTENWLAAREKHLQDSRLESLLNTNLFFAFFYASGRTIDTEELCMMTSRSPRYYVSAAYWDRDSLLWAFPAIVETDEAYARELLLAVFRRQRRNFGVHSRYIDGTVLEPGFELDELCAPVIALERYIQRTGDQAILAKEDIRDGLDIIVHKLKSRRHPEIALYSTFLQPTDDMHNYPWLTYDNVLVWKSLRSLAKWLNDRSYSEEAEQVRAAILAHCVISQDGKPVFAWSVDLAGNHDIYDEPPGSLQLLPFYGFCGMEDETWQNTMALIRNEQYELSFAGHHIAEIGCKHAPHPWILSICNSLLSGHREEALNHLHFTQMDNGIACESVNEDTGECETGAAFATCAGFLAYALCNPQLR